jgi:hypothetical protein
LKSPRDNRVLKRPISVSFLAFEIQKVWKTKSSNEALLTGAMKRVS